MKPERIEELRQAAKDAIHNGGRVTLEAQELLWLLPATVEIPEPEPLPPVAIVTEPPSADPGPVAPEEPKPVIQ